MRQIGLLCYVIVFSFCLLIFTFIAVDSFSSFPRTYFDNTKAIIDGFTLVLAMACLLTYLIYLVYAFFHQLRIVEFSVPTAFRSFFFGSMILLSFITHAMIIFNIPLIAIMLFALCSYKCFLDIIQFDAEFRRSRNGLLPEKPGNSDP